MSSPVVRSACPQCPYVRADIEKGDSPGEKEGKIHNEKATQSPSEQEIQEKKEKSSDIIEFDGDNDVGNPMNWAFRRKCVVTFILAGMTFTTTFTSSIFSTAIEATAKEFRVSTEVMTLGTSLFLLGFTLGPIIWGPISELYVRTSLQNVVSIAEA